MPSPMTRKAERSKSGEWGETAKNTSNGQQHSIRLRRLSSAGLAWPFFLLRCGTVATCHSAPPYNPRSSPSSFPCLLS